MQTAKIEEEHKPAYEAKIEDFDPANTKGSFEASQFSDPANKLVVPQSQFRLTVAGKTYRCRMLVATHFVIAENSEALSRKATAS